MKRSYFRILLLQESKKTTGETLSYYSDTEGKMRARVSTGDISEADLMKMMIERRKAERRVEELRVELAAEKARLGVLLGISVSDVSLSGGLPYEPVYPTMDETVERALENRSELKGRSMLIQASESALSAEKRSIMPAFEVEGGYRKNSDGFTGAVFGISVPLPLFDRNRGGTVRARAEMHAARLAVETGKKRLIADVSGLVNSILSIQTRIAALEEQVALSRSLIGIARLAYEEGESSLLDFLYTMRSGQDLAAEYHTALYEHASSIAEFEALTGFNTANGGVK
jgi:cobalt-zinc-cadmium efflux system outer membrane protein